MWVSHNTQGTRRGGGAEALSVGIGSAAACDKGWRNIHTAGDVFAGGCKALCSSAGLPSQLCAVPCRAVSQCNFRWLIIGPHRSGSSFHVDPNATCAWNAVVSGAKKWILFPPGVLNPLLTTWALQRFAGMRSWYLLPTSLSNPSASQWLCLPRPAPRLWR
jgi:hypothetical protein